MILTIDIKENVADKILYFLEHFKDDVKIMNYKNLDIETINKNDLDYKLYEEAKKRRENGEKIYNLNEAMQEFK